MYVQFKLCVHGVVLLGNQTNHTLLCTYSELIRCCSTKRKSKKALLKCRWIERLSGIVRMFQCYVPAYLALEENASSSSTDLEKSFHGVSWDANTKSLAQGLVSKMETFSFFVALVITKEILAYFRDLTVSLQGKMTIDVSVLDNFQGSQILVNTSQCKIRSSCMQSTCLSQKHYTVFVFIFCI